jgi:transposase-like protein
MSLARLVITAVVVEGRSHSGVARDYGISRVWVQKLVHRYQREGPAAFERSRPVEWCCFHCAQVSVVDHAVKAAGLATSSGWLVWVVMSFMLASDR